MQSKIKDIIFSQEDKDFMGATAGMLKDVIFHCIAAYNSNSKNKDKYHHGAMLQSILTNIVGNAIADLSEQDAFEKNCRGFTVSWQTWIDMAVEGIKERGKLQ